MKIEQKLALKSKSLTLANRLGSELVLWRQIIP